MTADDDLRLRHALDRVRVDLDTLRTRVGAVTGVGEALDGLVRVTCRAGGAIEDVRIDPRAMRRQSAELAAAFREAHTRATLAAAEATQIVLRDSGTFADVAGQMERGSVDLTSFLEHQGIPVRDLARRLGGG
ncbi:MAG TPA: YbaB/EbfC family nucleoid-associated protein [Mycobacteriales bacterium]|nr:YbaB/EbfC family nucleoid-associated protein [Mycobacteriales bacterium]